jgi:peptidoglycan/xylan/chitin deacetylase (PgdA/CDA1 family)
MLRQTLSQAAYAVSVGAGVSSVLRWLNQRKLLILMYHQIHQGQADPVENFDGLSVELNDFVRQMRYLARHYQVISLEQGLERSSTSAHRAVIAFDDAYASFHHFAYPVLRALGLPATVFVPTDFIEGRMQIMWWDRLRQIVSRTQERTLSVFYRNRPHVFPVHSQTEKQQTLRRLGADLRLLSVEEQDVVLAALREELRIGDMTAGERHLPLSLSQMREMAARSITFASHGQSHRSFLSLSLEEIAQEVRGSKATLEGWLDRPVTWFSYPFGDFDQRSVALLAGAGYEGAVTTIDGLNTGNEAERFELRRIAVGGQTTFSQFIGAASGVRDAMSWLHSHLLSMEEVRRADPVY